MGVVEGGGAGAGGASESTCIGTDGASTAISAAAGIDASVGMGSDGIAVLLCSVSALCNRKSAIVARASVTFPKCKLVSISDVSGKTSGDKRNCVLRLECRCPTSVLRVS